ncbi:MAG: hypothetical protein R3B54_02090 [Bdellovibrionota bacterium]
MWLKPASFALIVLLTACAGVPVVPPQTLGNTDQPVHVQLPERGKIILSQELRKNVTNLNCREFSKRFQVQLQHTAYSTRIPMHASCKVRKNHVVLYPRNFLAAGDYRVSIDRKQAWRYFYGKPELLVRYINADFKSDSDQVMSGATPAAKGNKIEGEVNYSQGDRTDWYQIDGENGMVSLTLLGENNAKDIEATVFRADGPKAKPLFKLQHGKALTARLGKSDVFVRVRGKRYTGPVKYSLLRRDFPITRVVSVPVIDSYRVSDSTSMLLLEAIEGMSVKDELSIKGKKMNGELISLGQCLVTSVEGGQASCKLPKVPKINIVELRAQVKVQG